MVIPSSLSQLEFSYNREVIQGVHQKPINRLLLSTEGIFYSISVLSRKAKRAIQSRDIYLARGCLFDVITTVCISIIITFITF